MLARHVAVGDLGDVGDQIGQPAMHAVDGILHLVVVALAGDLDLLAQVAAADQRRARGCLRRWAAGWRPAFR